jgi:serine/threonine-protein kinase
MEYLPGLSIERIVELDGPCPAGRAIYLLRQICGSLAEAHAAGLIHRDVKPANVIVCERGGLHDVAKVLDFGIARDMQGKATATDAGVAGTPMFMSPEALRGGSSIDARADIYSLGATAYYMVSGRNLFAADSAVEIAAQHLRDMPPPPSERLGRPVPADLEALIMRCLAKDPGERPASVEALSEALGACGAAGEWTEPDARRWWLEHAATVAALLDQQPGTGELAVDMATRPN